MFTGLVEEVGTIQSIISNSKSSKIIIKAKKILEDIKLGDSISTNGVCLTVVDFSNSTLSVDVMPESMRRSNLKHLSIGTKVNLERALKLSDRLGGHLVSGHIDGTGIISGYEIESNAIWLTISAPYNLLKYVVEKGSIAIDGISLTVAYVDENVFKVSIIPHTKEITTLINRKIGDEVNLECDMIGKYVEKLLGIKHQSSDNENINFEFLNRYGFI